MGADLYIDSLLDKRRLIYEPLFNAACEERDSHKRGTKAHAAAQTKANKAWEALYHEEGYFRDPYNGASLASHLGFSWWSDVIPMLDKDGNMSPDAAKTFRSMVENRVLYLPSADELKRDGCAVNDDSSVERWHRYFLEMRKELIAFLSRAIALNQPISCSL